MKRRMKILVSLAVICVLAFTAPFAARYRVQHSTEGRIYRNVQDVPKCRVAVVLGAYVFPSGALSSLLRDRVDAAIELYRAGKVEKILMSGDNRFSHYDEPTRMMEYAVKHGIPAEDVVMDFAGRRTYDSIYRAKHIFGLDRFIIVSQGFHVSRAIFLSKHIGVDAYGFAIDNYSSRKAENREILACMSAVLDVYVFHPKPVLGNRERI